MPKVVDHGERRLEIATAVWQIIAEQGLAGVTLRAIAARAGMSMGRVQHYFPSRDAIVVFGLTAYLEAASARFPAATPGPEGAPRPHREHARELALAAIPRTAEGKIGAKVWYAYLTEAITDPAIGAIVRSALTEAEDLFTTLLDRDRDAARSVLATVDGLVYRVLVGVVTPAVAEELVRAEFASPRPNRTSASVQPSS